MQTQKKTNKKPDQNHREKKTELAFLQNCVAVPFLHPSHRALNTRTSFQIPIPLSTAIFWMHTPLHTNHLYKEIQWVI